LARKTPPLAKFTALDQNARPPVKTALNFLLWTTRVDDSHLPLAGRLRELGYQGVEIPIHRAEPAHYAALGRRLRDLGLAATASTALPGPQADFLSDSPAARTAAADYLHGIIDSAAALGAEALAGPLYQALGAFTGLPPSDLERERAAAGLRPAAAQAAAAGLRLFLEPLNRFECHLVNTLAAGAALVQAVANPAVALLYDTFHANIEEADPLAAIDTHRPWIGHVHISENHRGAPGRGHLPLVETIRRFLAGGYQGWFTVEAFGTALPDLAAATRCWRPTFASPDEVCSAAREVFAAAARSQAIHAGAQEDL
jgi:D-psicose/D-tagatose/L-ribulose 3-epimerase